MDDKSKPPSPVNPSGDGSKSAADLAKLKGASQEAAQQTRSEVSKGLLGLVKIAAKHLPLVFGVYAMGYFNFSIAWILGVVGLTAATEQWRKERDWRMSAARASSIYGDKEVIMARVTDLPSWVHNKCFASICWMLLPDPPSCGQIASSLAAIFTAAVDNISIFTLVFLKHALISLFVCYF